MNHTANRRREIASLTAILMLGKSLAESIRFWISTGQVQASERAFASGQLRDFDAAWKEYGDLSENEKRRFSDKMSKITRKAS